MAPWAMQLSLESVFSLGKTTTPLRSGSIAAEFPFISIWPVLMGSCR